MFIASEDICFILIENILLIDKSTEGEREIGGREKRETDRRRARSAAAQLVRVLLKYSEVCGLRFTIGFPDIKRVI